MPLTVPTFVVAGAARAGTTAVTEALQARPDVFITRPKEPHYFAYAGRKENFSGPGDEALNRVAVRERRQYLALYPVEHSYAALGEASVSTLYHHQRALPELVAMNPDIKAVIILRDPVERAYATFRYLRAQGLEPFADFRDALAEEQVRIEKGWQHLWHYSAMSYYADAVENFLRTLGPERVGIWFYDDLAADAAKVIDEICRFLDLPPLPGPTPRLLALEEVDGEKPGGLRRLARSVLPGLGSRNGAATVPEEVSIVLAPRFGPDLDRLEGLLGRRLPAWPRF